MRVRWSPEADEDLQQIFAYISADNLAAARLVARSIYEGISSLKTLPMRGRSGKIVGTRELVLSPYPYIAVYQVQSTSVNVLHIYHPAQDWPY